MSKILRAHIESYKAIRNLDIEFKDHKILALVGDGNTGKTSVIEFFKSMMDGIVPEWNINNETGAAKGWVEVERDGVKYRISMSKTKSSDTIKVKGDDKRTGGKEALRELIGSVSIDPFSIKRKKPDQQLIEFKKLMRLDTTTEQAEIDRLTAEREAVGRDIRNMDGSIKNDPNNVLDPEAHAKKYEQELPLETRVEDLRLAHVHNIELAKEQERVQSLEQQSIALNDELKTIEQQIQTLLRLQDHKINKRQEIEATIALKNEAIAATPRQPVEQMQAEIDQINAFNRERAELQGYFQKIKDLERMRVEYADWTQKLEAAKEKKADKVKAATSIIPGFEFKEPKFDENNKVVDDAEGPHFNGIPISGLSTTETVRFGIALKTALDKAEGKRPMPVYIVDDLERFGSVGRAELEELCRSGECQAIVAMMDVDVPELKLVLRSDLDIPMETLRAPRKKRGIVTDPGEIASVAKEHNTVIEHTNGQQLVSEEEGIDPRAALNDFEAATDEDNQGE